MNVLPRTEPLVANPHRGARFGRVVSWTDLEAAVRSVGMCGAAGRQQPMCGAEVCESYGPDAGWYIDNRANPAAMLLCPTTCAADTAAVEVELSCVRLKG